MDPFQNPSYFITNPPTDSPHLDRDRDRYPQWTQAETKEFLSLRAELHRSFSETKRNKPLWEAISTRMQLKGFNRTPDQCKSKWKNLVTRYKGSEAVEGDRQFAYKEEMRSILESRMERVLQQEDQLLQEEEEEECSKNKKKKMMMKKRGRDEVGDIGQAVRDLAKRQMEMEMRWMEAAEAREAERRWKEEEWRREMVALHEERMEMEMRWRDREEERRAREDAREERRHAIIETLLNKISGERAL